MKSKFIHFLKKYFQSNWDRLALLGVGIWIMFIIIAVLYKEIVA